MSRELPILLGLAGVAGLVDAVSFLGLGHVFTANMTGNLVLLGFAVSGAQQLSVLRALTALAGFVAGALCGARAVLLLEQGTGQSALAGSRSEVPRDRAARAPRGALAFGLEPVVLLAAALVAWASAGRLAPSSAAGYAVIALSGIAMGLRNGAARKLGLPHVATTVVTTNLAELAADSRIGGGSRDLTKLAASILAMFAGAAIGAWLLRYSLAAPLGCGVILSAGCAMLAHSLCVARQ